MSTPEHKHQLLDAESRLPVISGNRVVIPGPIHCQGCDADQDTLIADARSHGHEVTEVDGKVVMDVVLP